MKNQKGITLIALVITIIVLLILAGVSISMISGDDGIATQAVRAKSGTQAADIREQVELIAANNKIEKYAGGHIATIEEVAIDLCEKGTITENQKEEIINTKKLVLESEIIDFEVLEVVEEVVVTKIKDDNLVRVMNLTNGTNPDDYLIDHGYYPIAVSGIIDDAQITGFTFYIKERGAVDSTYELADVRHPVSGAQIPGTEISNPVEGNLGSSYTFVAFNLPDYSKRYTLRVEARCDDGNVRYAEVDTPDTTGWPT